MSLIDQGVLLLRDQNGGQRTALINNVCDLNDNAHSCTFNGIPRSNQYDLYLRQVDPIYQFNEIPLGELISVAGDEEQDEWDTVLVPTSVHTLSEPDAIESLVDEEDRQGIYPKRELAEKFCRQGWLYLYVNGYLWREIKVLANGSMQDVNLSFRKGLATEQSDASPDESRIATSNSNSLLLLPYKINGEETTIQVAYSEVQWSWEQVTLMGGMNPDDPRLKQGVPLREEQLCKNLSLAEELRSKRFTEVSGLENYTSKFDMSEGPIGAFDENDIGQERYKNKGIAKLYLSDSIGVARTLSEEYKYLREVVHRILHSYVLEDERNASDPKKDDNSAFHKRQLALMIQNTFYQQAQVIKNSPTTTDEAKDFAEKMTGWKEDRLNEQAFNDYLEKEALIETAELIAIAKDRLITFLEDIESVANFSVCAYDFFYQDASNYDAGFELVREVTEFIKEHPASQFLPLVDDDDWLEDKSFEDRGKGLLLQLLGTHPDKEAHPLFDCLFPPEKDEENLVAEACLRGDELKSEQEDKMKPLFNIEKLEQAISYNISSSEVDGFQAARRMAQAVNGFLFNVIQLPEIAGELGQSTIQDAEGRRQLTEQDIQRNDQKIQQNQQDISRLNGEINNNSRRYQDLSLEVRLLEREAAHLNGTSEAEKRRQLEINTEIAKLETEKARLSASIHELDMQKKRLSKSIKKLEHLNKSIKGQIQSGRKFINASFQDAGAGYFKAIIRLQALQERLYSGREFEGISHDANKYFKNQIPSSHISVFHHLREPRTKEWDSFIRENAPRRGKGKNVTQVATYLPGVGDLTKLPLDSALLLSKNLQIMSSTAKQRLSKSENAAEVISKFYMIKRGSLTEQGRTIENRIVELEGKIDRNESQLWLKGHQLEEQERYNNRTNPQLESEVADIEAEQKKLLREKEQLNRQLASELEEESRLKGSTFAHHGAKGGAWITASGIGISGLVIGLEIYNINSANKAYAEHSSNYNFASKVGAYFDLAAEVFLAIENIAMISAKARGINPVQIKVWKFKSNIVAATSKIKLDASKQAVRSIGIRVGLGMFSLVAVGASVYSAAMSSIDAYTRFKKGDIDSGLGASLMSVGFLGTVLGVTGLLTNATSGILYVMAGAWGAACVGLVLLGAVIYYWLMDPPIADWLEATPWGSSPLDVDTYLPSKHWVIGEDIIYERILQDYYTLMFSPKVNMDYKGAGASFGGYGQFAPDFLSIDLTLPGFEPGRSEFDMELWYKLRNGDYNWVNGFDVKDDWSRLDLMAAADSVMQNDITLSQDKVHDNNADASEDKQDTTWVDELRSVSNSPDNSQKDVAIVAAFWRAATLEVKPNYQGWQIKVPFSFLNKMVQLKVQRGTNVELDFKLRVRYFPHGKGEKVMKQGSIEHVLPNPNLYDSTLTEEAVEKNRENHLYKEGSDIWLEYTLLNIEEESPREVLIQQLEQEKRANRVLDNLSKSNAFG